MYAVGEWVRTCCAPGPTNYFRCNLLLRCTLSAFGSLMQTRAPHLTLIQSFQEHFVHYRAIFVFSCVAALRSLAENWDAIPTGDLLLLIFNFRSDSLRSTEINPGPAELSVSHALQYDDNMLNFYYCAVYVSHYCYTSIEVNWINSMTRNKYSSIDATLRCNCTSAHRYVSPY